MTPTPHSLANELHAAFADSSDVWRALDGARVLLTGGTGFVGCWLLEAACWAAGHFDVEFEIDVVTRNPAGLAEVAPHLAAHRMVRLTPGDVNTAALPARRYTHVIHAATQTNVALTNPSARAVFDSCLIGTGNVLDLSARCGARHFLMISSGAVYDRALTASTGSRESDPLAPLRSSPASGYAIGKAAAEFLALDAGRTHGFNAVVARCFAFVGPYLPLQSHYAIGNFIADALAGHSIVVKGDGTPVRSYLYGADMACWLWTMLVRGQQGDIFNVGSDQPIDIGALAHKVHALVSQAALHEAPVNILGRPGEGPRERYLSNVDHARDQLGLRMTVPLDTAIRRTAAWARLRESTRATLPLPPRDRASTTYSRQP